MCRSYREVGNFLWIALLFPILSAAQIECSIEQITEGNSRNELPSLNADGTRLHNAGWQ
jgi:hypothetical protein